MKTREELKNEMIESLNIDVKWHNDKLAELQIKLEILNGK